MSPELAWRVAPEPVGRYRSFERRAWPYAVWRGTEEPAASISCADAYTPARARGDEPHALLRVSVADWSARAQDPCAAAFTWRLLRRPCATLAEAKALAERALRQHPEFRPRPDDPITLF